MSRGPAPACPACAARREQARRASAAGVASRRSWAALLDENLSELLEPMFRRDPDLSARAAARRLVEVGSLAAALEDRARRLGGRLRHELAARLAAIADRRQPACKAEGWQGERPRAGR